MPATNGHAHEAFRRNAKAAMERKGLSIRQLARETGLDYSGLHAVLSGTQGVTLERAELIANKLGVTLRDLLEAPEAVQA